MRLILRRIWRFVPSFCLILFGLGLLFRLTVQDSLWLAAPIYYATPPAVLGLLAVIAAVFWRRREKWKVAILLAAAIGCFVWHGVLNWYPGSPPAEMDSVRVVFWNTAREGWGFPGTARDLRQYDADIIGIVETGPDGMETAAKWHHAFPDYHLSQFGAQTLVLSRWPISNEWHTYIGPGSLYKELDIEMENQALHLFIVDLRSTFYMDREPLIQAIVKGVNQQSDCPVLIMGDFNLPGDSVHFELLRKTFANAFETAGRGYASTWPMFAPVIQIDHVWANRFVQILDCRHGWSWHSDHRPIVLEMRMKPNDSRSKFGGWSRPGFGQQDAKSLAGGSSACRPLVPTCGIWKY